ncbi:gluconokinase [Pseudoxanthomonas dokdonensis]|uniref:Gluconokinase n=2 Tax=Pseudoxanthomonas dokdonensis TaxID=344882 RepID=A0A0R0CK92_9GAMM|nr:gluconokinase [Pseudoxanthomonas dokdonensis]
MGVAGSGKTTLARGLADHYRYALLDADDWHSADARAQMAAGIPLSDAQRQPWVAALAAELQRLAASGRASVLAFSGLRAAHRQQLRDSGVAMRFLFLHAAPAVIAARLAARREHFMPPQLLESQLQALQPPHDEPDVIAIDGAADYPQVLAEALRKLDAAGVSPRR